MWQSLFLYAVVEFFMTCWAFIYRGCPAFKRALLTQARLQVLPIYCLMKIEKQYACQWRSMNFSYILFLFIPSNTNILWSDYTVLYQKPYPLSGKRPEEHELELTFWYIYTIFAALEEHQTNSRKQAICESREWRKSKVLTREIFFEFF